MDLDGLAATIDVDVAGSVERFAGHRPIFVKYLKRFPRESTFTAFLADAQSRDLQKLEVSAHTLKGICANLGLVSLARAYDRVVKDIRASNSDDLDAALSEATVLHQRTIAAIEELD
ncbi:MAG TPA: Hpt domain-containing protein [Candidatus Avisuccinivibrio pullicola]|nr:Hpt domain-containing protein [Candidatus Avisuccinivibrio pullicola]